MALTWRILQLAHITGMKIQKMKLSFSHNRSHRKLLQLYFVAFAFREELNTSFTYFSHWFVWLRIGSGLFVIIICDCLDCQIVFLCSCVNGAKAGKLLMLKLYTSGYGIAFQWPFVILVYHSLNLSLPTQATLPNSIVHVPGPPWRGQKNVYRIQ